jgi:hypothetical protein
MLIVSKAISLANSPALTEAEIGDRALDWYEALFPVVPEKYLQQAFQRAVHDHSGAFPLSCYEVINAFKALSGEIAIDQAKALSESSEAAKGCPRCLGTNLETIYNTDGSIRGVRAGQKCDHRPLVEGEWLFERQARIQADRVIAGNFQKLDT